jgi:NitT/TauT family transport system ATP-binding protein
MEAGLIDIQINAKNFAKTRVLTNISFQITPNERIAILGPSGTGKTTLLRMIAGLDTDFDGHVTHDASIAMMFQEPTLMPWRTASENIVLVTGVEKKKAEQILEELGLGQHCDHYPNQLSLGQMRRVSLACALCTDPDLLIMDEPFASLDEDTAEDMAHRVKETLATRKTALLLVTHSMSEAEFLTERTITLAGDPATIVPH